VNPGQTGHLTDRDPEHRRGGPGGNRPLFDIIHGPWKIWPNSGLPRGKPQQIQALTTLIWVFPTPTQAILGRLSGVGQPGPDQNRPKRPQKRPSGSPGRPLWRLLGLPLTRRPPMPRTNPAHEAAKARRSGPAGSARRSAAKPAKMATPRTKGPGFKGGKPSKRAVKRSAAAGGPVARPARGGRGGGGRRRAAPAATRATKSARASRGTPTPGGYSAGIAAAGTRSMGASRPLGGSKRGGRGGRRSRR
jgi:hypothetical protein